jgi:hypothetical protein
MPSPEIGRESLTEREQEARHALDEVRNRGPEAVQEETLRMKAELVRLYGWEGYQRILAKMESDLARLRDPR